MSQFIRKDLLTRKETNFFLKLRKALPDYYIFPQVSFNALIKAKDGSEWWNARNKFNRKVADFIIYDNQRMEVLAIIELDDWTHERKEDEDTEQDKMLSSAGYRIIRFREGDEVTIEMIKQEFPDHDARHQTPTKA